MTRDDEGTGSDDISRAYLCAGGELFTYLRHHHTFFEDDARVWGAEILLALEYLHSMDLIYRDLKPENVLLSSQGHVKLTDFGLARDVNDELTAKTVAGSPYYMAPEVLLMKGHDTQADWWSLGILIYEMLTVSLYLPPKIIRKRHAQHYGAALLAGWMMMTVPPPVSAPQPF